MNPDLIKVTEIFLIPSSFLVAALGTADTNTHRAGVSLLGLLISVLWAICSREALAEARTQAGPEGAVSGRATPAHRTRILAWLPLIFILGWLVATIVHLLFWNRSLLV